MNCPIRSEQTWRCGWVFFCVWMLVLKVNVYTNEPRRWRETMWEDIWDFSLTHREWGKEGGEGDRNTDRLRLSLPFHSWRSSLVNFTLIFSCLTVYYITWLYFSFLLTSFFSFSVLHCLQLKITITQMYLGICMLHLWVTNTVVWRMNECVYVLPGYV